MIRSLLKTSIISSNNRKRSENKLNLKASPSKISCDNNQNLLSIPRN